MVIVVEGLTTGEETMFLRTLPRILTLTFLLLFPCFLGCSRKDAASEEKDIAAITAVSKSRADAFNQGNAAAIAVHFTEDALLMAPDQPMLKGRAAVQSYYQHIFDEYETRLKSYYEEVKVSGRLGYGRGFAEVALIPKQGGQALTSTAKYINIMRREADGTWKTTHDIWNGNEMSSKR